VAGVRKSSLLNELVATRQFQDSVARLCDDDARVVDEYLAMAQAQVGRGALEVARVEATRSPKVRALAIGTSLTAIGLLEARTLYLAHVDRNAPALDWAVAHALELRNREIHADARVNESLDLGLPEQANLPFAALSDMDLDRLGVPVGERARVRGLRSARQVFSLVATLQADTIYALDAWALTGELPEAPDTCEEPWKGYVPTESPGDVGSSDDQLSLIDDDTLRLLLSDELDYLLTATQQRIVLGNPVGPSKVIGGPGTGKTLVAMYRARALAETGKTVLLSAYNKPLAELISTWLTENCSVEARRRITARHIHSLILTSVLNPIARSCREPWLALVKDDELARRLRKYYDVSDCDLSWEFVRDEWREVVLPRSFRTLDEYRGASRLGLGRRVGPRQEEQAWQVFGPLLDEMQARHEADYRMACRLARERLPELESPLVFDAVIVDEYQDLHIEELRFFEAVCGDRGLLLLLGDSGQRIYAPQTRLLDAGIDVGRRTHVLRRSYRSTQEVIIVAERVLGLVGREPDADGAPRVPAIASERGRPVELIRRDGPDEELDAVVKTIREVLLESPGASIGVLCLTNARRNGLSDCLRQAGIDLGGAVRVVTMHRSKGLEFDVVILAGMGEDTFPDPEWLQDEEAARSIGTGDLPRLLHVALSRGRERLVIVHSGQLSHHLAPGFAHC